MGQPLERSLDRSVAYIYHYVYEASDLDRAVASTHRASHVVLSDLWWDTVHGKRKRALHVFRLLKLGC
jgi:hypothetical protein